MHKVMADEQRVVYRQGMGIVLLIPLAGLLILFSNYFVRLPALADAVAVFFCLVGGFLGLHRESLQVLIQARKLRYRTSFAGWTITDKEDDFGQARAVRVCGYRAESQGAETAAVEHGWQLILECGGTIRRGLPVGVFTSLEQALDEARHLAGILNVQIKNDCAEKR